MSTNNPSPPSDDTPSPAHCPSCAAPLPPGAVLCVACGYHLKLERHLATAVEKETPRPIDPNPYAPSSAVDATGEPRPREPHIADLTEAGARRAKAIVDEADMVYYTIPFAWCCCQWILPLMLPWYGWRLWSWHALNAQFYELRHPYGFSPHGELAGAFQDCKIKLWVGLIAGAVFWLLALYVFVVDAVRILMS